MKYSNPRMKAIIGGWPIGGDHRGSAIFTVENNVRHGERCSRVNERKDGTWSKPKYTTYADACRIVDGDNGRTYVAQFSEHFNQIVITQGNLKYSEETVFVGDSRYQDMLLLFE